MCGISGIIYEHYQSNYEESISNMMKALSHRGPDEEGIHSFKGGILAHKRLSIVDIRSGKQPMLSNCGKNSIVFNGEIYGYKNIVNELSDYKFKTSSDTEVILALYDKYNSNLFNYLPGMFAFAIWDDEQKSLVCGRDRFGEKPLYYSISKKNEFIFASELKSIIKSGLIEPEIDRESIHHYLKTLYVHPNKTIYKNIFVVPPAHYLVYKNKKVEIVNYWRPPATNYNIKFNEAKENFSWLLEEAVKKQLIADVPVGAFLSGGIDSSLVVALASRQEKKLTTISFGFGNSINELPFAKLIANRFGTNHIEIRQELEEITDLIEEMQNVYDEPFADSSNIPTYLISKEAKKLLKVVMTGDGGDEMLCGYPHWYKNLVGFEKAREVSDAKLEFYKLMNKVYHRLGSNKMSALLAHDKWLEKGLTTVNDVHETQNIYFSDEEISTLGLSSSFNFDNYLLSKPENNLNDAMKMDISNYLPGDILVKTDRASMANSIELRAPFLDVKLAEFCLSLPDSFKINHHEDKIIAKRAFSKLLPQKILNRKKQGFGAPVSEWLNQKRVKEMVNAYLVTSKQMKIFDFLDYTSVQKYVNNPNYKLWILLNLSVWLEKNRI